MYLFLKSWQPREEAISHVLTHAHIGTITADTNLYDLSHGIGLWTQWIFKKYGLIIGDNCLECAADECAAKCAAIRGIFWFVSVVFVAMCG